MICDVCGSNNYTEIGIIKNIWKNDKKVYQCSNCRLYFIDQPTDEEIYLLYKNEYHNNIKNKLFEKAKSKMRYARSLSQFNFVSKYIDCTNKKVCEIGAFDGLLLSIFKKYGCDVYGYELNDNARDYAKAKYNIDLKPNFLESEEKYDIIMLSHVIEHFKNTSEILLKIKNMLKPNGYLYTFKENGNVEYKVNGMKRGTGIFLYAESGTNAYYYEKMPLSYVAYDVRDSIPNDKVDMFVGFILNNGKLEMTAGYTKEYKKRLSDWKKSNLTIYNTLREGKDMSEYPIPLIEEVDKFNTIEFGRLR